jgi:hypothetical protein
MSVARYSRLVQDVDGIVTVVRSDSSITDVLDIYVPLLDVVCVCAQPGQDRRDAEIRVDSTRRCQNAFGKAI